MDNTKLQLQKLNKQLLKVESALDKCRTSTIQDGWQTQRFAKKSRKWDYYAQEKMRIKQLIDDCENVLAEEYKNENAKFVANDQSAIMLAKAFKSGIKICKK